MPYTIQEISKKTGLSIDTLRYYDKLNIVSPLRGKNGYRQYSEEDVMKLEYAVVMKYAQFSLDDVKNMLSWFDKQPPCDDCNEFFHSKLENNITTLEKRIKLYQQLVLMMKQVLPMISDTNSYKANESMLGTLVHKVFQEIRNHDDEMEIT